MLQTGTNDVNKVSGYSDAELRAEALRLANNHRLTGAEYTAAVLERLAK
jgi:hypothetical protein